MKRKTIVIILFSMVIFIGMFALLVRLIQGPVFTKSTSPDGVYTVVIRNRRGWELLNAPEHLAITVSKSFSMQQATVYTQINNNMSPIVLGRNVHIIWEDSQLTIILFGCEQRPEIITVSLEKKFPFERHEYYGVSDDILHSILDEYGVLQEYFDTAKPS